jgi:hypothetical protein
LSILDGVPQNIAERAILLLAETAGVDLVFRLANAVYRVLLDDAEFDSISENAAEQTDRPGRRTGTTADDCASAQLVGLDVRACLYLPIASNCRREWQSHLPGVFVSGRWLHLHCNYCLPPPLCSVLGTTVEQKFPQKLFAV